MKITVTPTGTGTTAPKRVTLGDDENGEYISGFLPGRETLKQIAQRLRASGSAVFERGNTQTSVPWNTARQHASYQASLKFIRDHCLDVPKRGLIEITQGGTEGFSLFLPDAAVDFRFVQLEGVATMCAYTVIGGEFQSGTAS